MDPVTSALGITPGKIIAVHVNYRSRAAQRGRIPTHPSYFLKAPSSLAADGAEVARPADCELLGFEGEIALVIGKPARNVSPEDGWSHVGWVSASNDLGLYDLRHADRGANLRSKSGDGFTPIGPQFLAARGLEPRSLRVRTWVNGEQAQCETTEDLLFDFGHLVADLSRLSTLEPGDVILTGTPAGVPVRITSPGSNVDSRERSATRWPKSNNRSSVVSHCACSPFTQVRTRSDRGSSPRAARNCGPIGVKPSPLFDRRFAPRSAWRRS